ncbi:MAG: site-specific DNA-methyltransferase, partial [Bacillota bacterium]
MLKGKTLLSDEGVHFVRCDNNGNHLVRMISNDIFGESNFQSELLVQRIRKNVTSQGKISIPLANDSLFMYYKTDNSKLIDPFLELPATRESYWRRIDDSAGFRNPPERY